MATSPLLGREASTTTPAVALRAVRKVHGKGDGAVVALAEVS